MKLDKNRLRELFIMGSINLTCMLYKEAAGTAGLIIYLWIRWRKGLPDYMTKKVSEWVVLDNVAMERYGFGMDPKTKNKALRKLEKADLIQLHLEAKSGKAPRARLLVK